ncbi:hypothetical protein ACIRD6_03145 [Streptomyces sp. NPDC102473]|uniref:hypothetical protein n=1 Tax=Streptomyces sp. NPDC102473 TaxID=3366180 RepID=UPI0037F10D86
MSWTRATKSRRQAKRPTHEGLVTAGDLAAIRVTSRTVSCHCQKSSLATMKLAEYGNANMDLALPVP